MAFQPGFDPTEAETLIAIDAELEGPSPPLAVPPIPANWQLEFDSPVLGITDQKWQLWKNTDVPGQYALAIRGTVGKAGSVAEDLLSVMIPAQGSLTVEGIKLSYKLAGGSQAAVHLGFTIGLAILLFDGENGMVAQLLKRAGRIEELFITGHSQGASIATLLRSYLEYSTVLRPLDAAYKTYVFAQAKPGNDHYAYDFEAIASNRDMAFRVANSQDWVPQSPFTIELPRDLNHPNPFDLLSDLSGLDGVAREVRSLEEKVAEAVKKKHHPHFFRLAKILEGHDLLDEIVEKVTGVRTDVAIEKTFNFVGAGPEVALLGTPGTNPDDPKDFFWQHHAAMYYDLLVETFGSGK